MTDAINTNNRSQSSSVSTSNRADANASGKTAGKQGKSDPSSIVELSSSNVLKDIGDQIRNIPDINNARVESIKQGLANGEYAPNPEVIARKFIEIEKLLP